MSDEAAFLAAIQQEPDDDSPRLIYADWLDERGDSDRAEFIRLQIQAEYHLDGSPEHSRLTDRALELLSKNGDKWANGYDKAMPVDAVLSVHKDDLAVEYGIMLLKERKGECQGSWTDFFVHVWFRRGFVDRVQFTPEEFFDFTPRPTWPTGPLPTLHLQLCHRDDSLGTLANFVRLLATAPLLDRFRDICLVGGFGSTTREGVRQLANEPALLAKLAGLMLSEDRIGDPEVLQILESPLLAGLRELCIDDTECTSAIVDLIVRSDRFRSMTYLHLWGVIQGARSLRLFAAPGRWPRLRRLVLGGCGLDDLTLKGLMRAGAFPSLEVLDLSFSDIHRPVLRALLLSGAFPRLRRLGVGACPLTLDEVQALRAEFGHRVEIYFPVPRRRVAADLDRGP